MHQTHNLEASNLITAQASACRLAEVSRCLQASGGPTVPTLAIVVRFLTGSRDDLRLPPYSSDSRSASGGCLTTT